MRLSDLPLLALAKAQTIARDARAEHGQTLAEYSLIITVVAVGLVLLAMMTFRDALGGAFDATRDCLDGVC
jgi:Flp pilus assembly pilin Flp